MALRCVVGFHCWTVWASKTHRRHAVLDYLLYPNETEEERSAGHIFVRFAQTRRCLDCGLTDERNLGDECGIDVDSAVAFGHISEYERRRLGTLEPLEPLEPPSLIDHDTPLPLLCRFGFHDVPSGFELDVNSEFVDSFKNCTRCGFCPAISLVEATPMGTGGPDQSS